ncbi:MAG: hypothetical protein D3910_07490 [Candidatus Electrothrix sp. ATG2]|nr:hypothetical protein [Candidatus Electrothrix sp. ATG2]
MRRKGPERLVWFPSSGLGTVFFEALLHFPQSLGTSKKGCFPLPGGRKIYTLGFFIAITLDLWHSCANVNHFPLFSLHMMSFRCNSPYI